MTLHRCMMLALLCLTLAAMPHARAGTGEVSLRAMTFNVKVDFDRDDTAPPWEDRKARSAEVVRAAQADLIGFQECSPAQLAFFAEHLPDHEYLGAIPFDSEDPASPLALLRNFGITAYTDAILFYRRGMFEVHAQGHWWLSPTPDKISTGFGNLMPRVLTWARLHHLPSGAPIVVAVTHFDNTSPAQREMAPLAIEQLQPHVDAGLPVLFLGDFNTDQTRGDYSRLVSGGWRDSYRASPFASTEGRDDNVSTSVGRGRIDHIFYHGTALTPLTWEILLPTPVAPPISDHHPVCATFRWTLP